METINMLGKPCPIPVIEAKKCMAREEINKTMILVDNIVAVQNLEKMAKGIGYDYNYAQTGQGEYTVTLSKNENMNPQKQNDDTIQCEIMPVKSKSGQGVTVLIPSDTMGRGSEELGKILIKGFIFSLTELPQAPETVIFLNAGVHLVTNGSNTVEDLEALQQKGSKIIACGTCLNYYGETEQLAVGEIVDMYAITTALSRAANVISI